MARKTEGVRLLVQEVMTAEFTNGYGEDIIRDVCFAIERNREWRRQYDELSDELRAWVVNNWIGKYVKEISGLNNLKQVPVEEGHIITSYTQLGHGRIER